MNKKTTTGKSLAKMLVYDVETMGILGWTWKTNDTNIIHIEHHTHLLSISYKWLGGKRVYFKGLPDFPDYDKNRHNDKQLAKFVKELFNEADVVIAHNADRFDNRVARAAFKRAGLTPPSPYQSIDTLKIARKYFRFDSNKLDDLGQMLGLGRKVKHEGFSLWLDCDAGKRTAWKRMAKYNKQDVVLLEKLYYELRPDIVNHPSMALFDGRPRACPNCGAKDALVKFGFKYTRVGKFQAYQCKVCGARPRDRKSIKTNVEVV